MTTTLEDNETVSSVADVSPPAEADSSTRSSSKEEEEEEEHATFRKRRLSIPLADCAVGLDDDDEQQSSSKRRLSFTNNKSSSSERSSNNDSTSSNDLVTRTLHADELDNTVLDDAPTFFHPPAPTTAADAQHASPRWKQRRHNIRTYSKLPFPKHVVGTYSCHGMEPVSYNNNNNTPDDDTTDDDDEEDHVTTAKINQDRGGVVHPFRQQPKTALFAVYDGHGRGGEHISQYCLHEIVKRLEELDADYFHNDLPNALVDTFTNVDRDLHYEQLIDPLFAGTTACVGVLQDTKLTVANAGDSRAVGAKKKNDTGCVVTALDLTRDHNPDAPGEMERIQLHGGYVSLPPSPGLSARVWLDETCTQIGLAMSRSIGDHMVSQLGVISKPEITIYDTRDLEFLIFATDGVWEFIDSNQAVQIVADSLMHHGAHVACQALIQAAAKRWHEEEKSYRDDITAIVVDLRNVWNH